MVIVHFHATQILFLCSCAALPWEGYWPYMPGAISLAATHKGKIHNIRHQALRDQQQSGMPKKSFVLTFEKITRKYDEEMKQSSGDSKGIWFKVPHNRLLFTLLLYTALQLLCWHIYQCDNWLCTGDHLEEYSETGHPYVAEYSLTSSTSWALFMSPLMANVLAEADFIEVDLTYQVSTEFS